MIFEIPLTKLDEEKRLVIGQAAAECLDKSGESMDYASAKEAFQKWSDEFHSATSGLSRGNLRVMHTKQVAGKIVDLSFDDAAKAVNIVAKVSDPTVWEMCADGALSGFSIGGGYAKKWTTSDGLKKYTPIIREISLVDSPCIPTARFAELIKADGVVEQIELHGRVHGFAEMWAARPAEVETFAKMWAGRPRTFNEMQKSFRAIAQGAGIAAGALGVGAAVGWARANSRPASGNDTVKQLRDAGYHAHADKLETHYGHLYRQRRPIGAADPKGDKLLAQGRAMLGQHGPS